MSVMPPPDRRGRFNAAARLLYRRSRPDALSDCGGAFYSSVPKGYEVIPPPIGATVTTLPSGADDQNMTGLTYFTDGGGVHRPFYSGSTVIYMVVAKPA